MDDIIRSAYYSAGGARVSSHYHDCHQIIFVKNGKVNVLVNGVTKQAGQGSIVLFSRYENHSVEVLSPMYERYVLRLSPTLNSSKLYSLLSNRPEGFDNVIDVSGETTELERLFARIAQEKQSNELMAPQLLELLLNELLIMMYRHIPSVYSYINEQAFDDVLALQRRFETDYSNQYTLEGLAKEYNISPSSLSHRFKRITGSSVMGYLLGCRIASAKNLLIKTDLSIGEIVEQCGFSDVSNFSRTFKQINGISPTQFRAKYRH